MTVYYPRCYAALSVVFDGIGTADSDPLLIEVAPRSATINRNGYNEADTWSLSFDARALPLDPNLIRSAAVRIYMFAADGQLDDRDWATPEHEVLVGLVDNAELALTDAGQLVHFDGRDTTGLLLDREWDPRDRIPAGKHLSKTVVEIVSAAIPPGTQPFGVLYDSDTPDPIVGQAHRSTRRKGFHVKPGKSYWDVIYEMCLRHGLIAYVEGESVIITEPRVQFARSARLASTMVYGRNLKHLTVSRRFAKERIPQVVVTSYDPRSRRVIEAVFPEQANTPVTGIGTKRDERLRVTAPPGLTDRAVLQRFARTYAENLARNEATYAWQTRHLQELNGGDLFQLRAGHPQHIVFDAFNQETMRQLGVEQRQRHLRELGYSREVSQFVARHFDRLGQFQQPYYTRAVTLQFDSRTGVEIASEAVNYAFVPREEAAA